MPFEQVLVPMPVQSTTFSIGSIEEYEKATKRASELAEYPEGSAQADELASLVQAIMQWDKSHDDATAWN
ncbi:hypothetical protein ACWIEX_11970 [Bosea sp. NPDC055353]